MHRDAYPLYNLISNLGERKVQEALDAFVCDRDEDVCYFLQEIAIKSELNHSLRTYVVIDDDSSALTIMGFYAVGITAMQEKDLQEDPLEACEQIPVFLLAQIARDDRYKTEDLDGTDLLIEAEDTIRRSSDLTGGQAIFLDCKEALLQYYLERDYTFVLYDDQTRLYRLTKPIYDSALQ